MHWVVQPPQSSFIRSLNSEHCSLCSLAATICNNDHTTYDNENLNIAVTHVVSDCQNHGVLVISAAQGLSFSPKIGAKPVVCFAVGRNMMEHVFHTIMEHHER